MNLTLKLPCFVSGDAGAVANEAISLINTVHSFGGQKEEALPYDEKLSNAYRFGLRKGLMSGVGMLLPFRHQT